MVGANAVLAYRLRPMYRPVATQGQGLEAYRITIDPHRRLLLGVILGFVGLRTYVRRPPIIVKL